jgi:hypothetical protein
MKPLTEHHLSPRKRKRAGRPGRWWEKLATWQRTQAARDFERGLSEIKH